MKFQDYLMPVARSLPLQAVLNGAILRQNCASSSLAANSFALSNSALSFGVSLYKPA